MAFMSGAASADCCQHANSPGPLPFTEARENVEITRSPCRPAVRNIISTDDADGCQLGPRFSGCVARRVDPGVVGQDTFVSRPVVVVSAPGSPPGREGLTDGDQAIRTVRTHTTIIGSGDPLRPAPTDLLHQAPSRPAENESAAGPRRWLPDSPIA
jgi:hypothetical protein